MTQVQVRVGKRIGQIVVFAIAVKLPAVVIAPTHKQPRADFVFIGQNLNRRGERLGVLDHALRNAGQVFAILADFAAQRLDQNRPFFRSLERRQIDQADTDFNNFGDGSLGSIAIPAGRFDINYYGGVEFFFDVPFAANFIDAVFYRRRFYIGYFIHNLIVVVERVFAYRRLSEATQESSAVDLV